MSSSRQIFCRLYEAQSNSKEMAHHPIHRTMLLALGPAGTLASNRFAFMRLRGDGLAIFWNMAG